MNFSLVTRSIDPSGTEFIGDTVKTKNIIIEKYLKIQIKKLFNGNNGNLSNEYN